MNAPRALVLLLLVVLLAVLAAASLSFAADASPAVSPGLAPGGTHPPPAGTPVPPALSDCPDPYDPNETLLTAYVYGTGGLYAHICDVADVDWFAFYAVAGKQIDVGISSLPDNYDLCLTDGDYSFYECSQNPSTTNERIRRIAADTRYYYVQVYGVDGAYNAEEEYYLGMLTYDPPTATPTATATPTCPDAYEPNDTFASAWEIPLTTHILYRYGDVESYMCYTGQYTDDFWKFYVTAGETIQLDLTSSLPGQISLALHDPYDYAWITAYVTRTTPGHIVLTATETGWWRARVFTTDPSSFSNSDSYHLEVRISYTANTATPTPTATATPTRTRTPTATSTPGCPDPYEPNDTFATAWEISMTTYPSYRYGHVYSYPCEGDQSDYWMFYVTAGERIQLNLASQASQSTLVELTLWDPNAQSKGGYSSGEPIQMIYQAGITGWWRAFTSAYPESNAD